MEKILYFLAGAPGIPATSTEADEIDTINDLAIQQYEVHVMCGGSRASITGINLSADQSDNSLNDAGSTITGTGISASATDNSLNDSGNGFVTAGFKAGDVLTIAGFSGAGDPDNNTTGTAVAESVVAGKIVVSGVTLVSDDAGEAVTVSTGGRFLQRGFVKDMIVMARGFTTSANNTSAGTIESLTATKMILSGAAGAAIVDEVAGDTVTICSVETGILAGDSVIAADYISGTVPEQYKSNGTPIYTVFDPAAPPESAGLAATQAIISNAETVNVKNSALTTTDPAAAVVASHACYVKLPATQTVVTDADPTTISTKAITLAVATGALGVGTFTNATDCAVSDGASTTVEGSAATVAVATRALGATTLTATTKKVVTDQDATTITGTGTAQAIKIGVAARALSGATFTNATDTAITNGVSTTIDSKAITLAVGSRALGVATFTNATDCAISNNAATTLLTKPITLAVGTNTLGVASLTNTTDGVVSDGDHVTVEGATVDLEVTGNAITGGTLAEDKAIVTDATPLTVEGHTVTLGVATHVLSGTLAETATIVDATDTITVAGAVVTLGVAAHVLSGTIVTTKAIVSSTQEIPINSGAGNTKVTITVDGNAITNVVLS